MIPALLCLFLSGVFLFSTFILQWWLLKEKAHLSANWIPASISGGVLAILFMESAINTGILEAFPIKQQYPIYTAICFLGGCILGVSQWPILRPQFKFSGLWIPISGIAFGLRSLVMYLFNLTSSINLSNEIGLLIWFVLVYCLVSGLTLALLPIKQPTAISVRG